MTIVITDTTLAITLAIKATIGIIMAITELIIMPTNATIGCIVDITTDTTLTTIVIILIMMGIIALITAIMAFNIAITPGATVCTIFITVLITVVIVGIKADTKVEIKGVN